jgi:uncharacterized protein VirK/YbjX
MDKVEAKEILKEHINRLRKLHYSELCKYLEADNIDTPEAVGKTGTKYQLEIQAVWDDKKEGHLRVMVCIDDGGWRAFFPMSDDFIIAPNGAFVDE